MPERDSCTNKGGVSVPPTHTHTHLLVERVSATLDCCKQAHSPPQQCKYASQPPPAPHTHLQVALVERVGGHAVAPRALVQAHKHIVVGEALGLCVISDFACIRLGLAPLVASRALIEPTELREEAQRAFQWRPSPAGCDRTWQRAFSRIVSTRSCSGCSSCRLWGSARVTCAVDCVCTCGVVVF